MRNSQPGINTQSQNVRAVYQKMESMLKEAANKNYRLCAHMYWESISLIKLSKPPGYGFA